MNPTPSSWGSFATASSGPIARFGPWAAGGVSGVASWVLHHSSIDAAFAAVCCVVLAQISVIDLRERRIPNQYTYAGVVIALLIALLRGNGFVQALLGMLMASLAMGVLYLASRGKLGLGDVKLGGLAGAILGIQAVPAFLVASTLLGTVAAIVLLIRTRDRHTFFAYGPYMAAAAAALLILEGPAGSQ